MASAALRQIFLDVAIDLARNGDTQAARDMNAVVRQADAEAGRRGGRKRRVPQAPVCEGCRREPAQWLGGNEWGDCPACEETER